MKMANQNTNKNKNQSLNKAAEAWVRLCLFHIRHKKQVTNQHQNKKYEYQTT